MKILSVLIFVGIFVGCSETPSKSLDDASDRASGKEITTTNNEPFYEVIVVEITSSQFGYQILKDGQLMIDQKNIPAVQGNKTFSTRKDAEKTAIFALDKIKNGVFPPTISVDELDSLGVL